MNVSSQGCFPTTRMRRIRRFDWSRRLVCEHRLTVDDLIWPVFIHEGRNLRESVPSMPGVDRLSIDLLVDAVGEAAELGVPAVALFPATDASKKTPNAEEALNPENLVCRAVRAVKQAHGDKIGVVCDVALDPYSSHGQDGLVRDGYVVNDETVEVLRQQAVVQAQAGCDVIAPSDMMDGRVGAIRDALDGAGLDRRADHVVRGQVRFRLLRSISRRRRILGKLGQRGQKDLPDGPGQCR